MKRRNFLFLAGAGALAIATPTWYFNFYQPTYNPLLAKPELLSNIWDNETIVAIGKEYLQKFPDENSVRKLSKILSKETSSNSNNVNETLNQKIVSDFIDGRIIMIDGWLLSETETRQCALFSLTQAK
jgi:hypothetical protein